VAFTGLLTKLLWQEGSPLEAQELVEGGPTRLIDPVPGERYALPITPAPAL
jgi:hypothetical protein